MAEMVLRATGSKLKIISEIHVTSTQAQYDTCLFEFDEAWDGYGLRTAVFYSHPKNIRAMVLGLDNRCFIPWDAFSHSRYLYIGVYGNNGESYLPTQFVEIMYQPGAKVDDHLYPPTPGIYEQIARQMTQVRDDIGKKADMAQLAVVVDALASKADRHQVETLSSQLASLASGSPAGTFANLADLTSADPDHSRTYVTTDNGHWYYWGGTAWISGGVYQAQGIGNSTVSPEKTTFLQPSGKNLFNKHTTVEGYISINNGTVREGAGNLSSDFIPVVPGSQYAVTWDSRSRMAFYNSSKSFLSGMNMSPTFTVPAGAMFLRFSFNTAYLDPGRVQLEAGSTQTPFEPFGSTAKASELVNLKRIDPYETSDTIIVHKRDHNVADMSVELSIHVPGVVPGQFVNWIIRRYTDADPALNYDIWRTMDVGVSHGDPPVLFKALTSRGEFDMALQLAGRDDFIGGSSHGDEVMTSDGLATLDGVPLNIVSAGDYRLRGKEFRLVVQSNLFDPADHTTLVAKHRKEWIISKSSGFRLRQRVEWLVPLQLERSFLGMLPILRKDPPTTGSQVTDRGFNDLSGDIYDITEDRSQTLLNVPTTGVKRLCVYGNETGIWAMGEVRNTPELPQASAWVSTNPSYNKLYFDFCGLNHSVAAGDVWTSDFLLSLSYRKQW